jgi:hypothetical protein
MTRHHFIPVCTFVTVSTVTLVSGWLTRQDSDYDATMQHATGRSQFLQLQFGT